eukprot:Tbor_TRINITY_DN6136_c1_g3::TRINITY_DN6136_c1_g3_i2::g.21646::m.21646
MSLVKIIAGVACFGVSVVGATTNSGSNSESDTKMKTIGIPIVFTSYLVLSVLLTHKQLISAFKNSNKNYDVVWVFRASMVCALFSVFFYASAAWNYGIVSTVIAYGLACATTGNIMQIYGKYIAAFLTAWFLVLIGVPSSISPGIVNVLNEDRCMRWYDTNYPEFNMCNSGWLTFLLILATVQISITFLSVLTVLAASMGSSVSESLQGIRGYNANTDYISVS